MTIVDEINESWGWIGLEAQEVVGENDFGNLIIKDLQGRYWRLCPEDLYCHVVAESQCELDVLSQNQEFLRDWYMSALVDQAFEKLGVLAEGRKYCLKIPGPLGGEYGGDNLACVPLIELLRFTGDVARQIKELPGEAPVQLKVVED